MRLTGATLFTVLALTAGAGHGAQAPASDGLETVIVTATRTERSADTIGSAVSVIGRADIERRNEKNMLGLFNQLPGVYATESGGLGGTTNVRLRGADSDQTLVLLDGMRVNDPASAAGDFDFSSLLVTDIERIEVVRGPQSTLWGSDAIGGVINIITRKGDGRPSGSVFAEGGSFSTYRLGGSVRGAADRLRYALSGSGLSTDGFSRVDENLGATERDGSELLTFNANLNAGIYDNYAIDLVAHYSDADADTDPSLSGISGDGEASSRRSVSSAQIDNNFTLSAGALRNRLSLFTTRTEREFHNPRNSQSRSLFDGRSYGAEYQGDIDTGAGTLVFGARRQVDSARGSSRGGLGRLRQFDEDFDTDSVYLQWQSEPLPALHLTLGMRRDDFEIGGTENTYRVTAAKHFAGSGTVLRGSYGTGVKAPTIYQAFFNGPDPIFGGTLSGNPELAVEESEGFDIGIRQSLLQQRLTLELSHFRQDIDNLIEFQSVVFGVSSTYVNIASVAISEGYELTANWRLGNWLSLNGSYTHLIAVDEATDNELACTPRETAAVGMQFQPTPKWSIGLYGNHVGAQFNRSRQRQRLDGFTKLDLSVQYQLTDSLQLFARIDNVSDREYQYILNAGTADRSAYAGFRLAFK